MRTSPHAETLLICPICVQGHLQICIYTHIQFWWNEAIILINVTHTGQKGYMVIDIKTKLSALKVAWVTRLLDDNFRPWKIIPTILFTTFGGINNVFHHNFKASKQCRSKVSRLPKFYQELIQLWLEVGEIKCSNASEIWGEVLWNNAWILSNGETLCKKHFVDKGILMVKNIIDESGRPLSWAEAEQKYNLNNSHVFNWFGIIKSIPRNWKKYPLHQQIYC